MLKLMNQKIEFLIKWKCTLRIWKIKLKVFILWIWCNFAVVKYEISKSLFREVTSFRTHYFLWTLILDQNLVGISLVKDKIHWVTFHKNSIGKMRFYNIFYLLCVKTFEVWQALTPNFCLLIGEKVTCSRVTLSAQNNWP